MKVAEFIAEFRKRYEALSTHHKCRISDVFMYIEGPTIEMDLGEAWEEIENILLQRVKESAPGS